MIKQAFKAVMGVGKKEDVQVTELKVIFFAFLVTLLFLGFIASMMVLVSVL